MTVQKKAFLCAISAVLCWSTVATAFKIGLQNMSALQLLTVSMWVATIALGLYIFITKDYREILSSPRQEIYRAMGTGCIIFSYYMILFTAYERLPAQIAQAINYTWAIFLTLFSVWFLRQKLDSKEFVWILFAYSGIVIISLGGGASFGKLDVFGLFLAFLSTVFYALYWVFGLKNTLSNINQLFINFLIGSLCGTISIILLQEKIVWEHILPAVYIGLFELSISFVLWGMALRLSTSVSLVASLPFLSPFISLIWIYFILGENIAYTTLLGLIFIVVGSYMQQRIAHKKK